MIFLFLAYVVLCLFGVKIKTTLDSDYLSIENTQAIKGIFIILVFFSHFNSYVNYTHSYDSVVKTITAVFSQTMVTMFLFYSGYGIMESIRKKGVDYIKAIPLKRVLATLFKFSCAVLVFGILGACLGEKFSLPTVLLSVVGWESLGNSNWYIFVVVVLYLLTYVSFRFLSGKKYIVPLLITLFLTSALILGNLVFHIKPLFWVDTALCYVLGMFYSCYKEKAERILSNNVAWVCLTLLCMGATVALKIISAKAIFVFAVNLLFAVTVVLITMRVTFKNKALVWCGKHLFELYILQRIPMILFKHLGLDKISLYLYFVVCLVVTLALVFPFKYATDKLWGLVLKGIVATKNKKIGRKKRQL